MKRFFFLFLLALFACTSPKKLKIAATSIPHAEILEFIALDMKEAGYPIEIVVIDDYQLPNRMLQEREVDANFFQHVPFLEEEMARKGYDFEILAYVHGEPLGLYSKKHKNGISSGAKIAIPSDTSNEKRALLFLENRGLITLKGKKESILDIQENPLKLDIKELDAPLLTRMLEDVDFAIIPGNFAIQAGLSPNKDSIDMEPVCDLYPNVLVVRKESANREDLQLLKSLLNSNKMAIFINKKYKGAIKACF